MYLLECLSVSICAWVFFEVLTAPGMIMDFWYTWLEKLNERGIHWLAKPLGLCGTCNSGQWGFWWYAFAYRADWNLGGQIVFSLQVIAGYLMIKKAGQIVEAWLNKLKKG